MRTRSILLTAALTVGLLASAPNALQAQIDIADPFKVGTFEIQGTPSVGIVLSGTSTSLT